jgi:hypothetical protein
MASAPPPVFFLPLQYSNVDSISGIQPTAVSASTPIPPTYSPGLNGQSAYFYNSTAPVGANVCSAYDVSTLNLKTFTVSMWYLPLLLDGATTQCYIELLDAGLYSSYTGFPFTSSAAAGTVYMSLNTSIFNLPLVLNKWAHFAYTIDSSGNFILYMNGVQVGNVTTNQVGSYTTTTSQVTGSGGTVTLPVASLSNFTNGMVIVGLPSGYGTVTITSPPSSLTLVCSYTGSASTINSGTAIVNLIPGNTYTTSAFPNYVKYLVLGNQVYNAKPATVQIQDVRIYKSVLTPAQIYGIYQSRGIPPRLAMVPSAGGAPSSSLAWQFEGNTTDTITGLTGTTTGSVSYNSSGKYGQSLIMNGSSYVKYSTTLGYNLGTGGATFAMWFKLLAVPVGSAWIFGASGTSYGDRIYILLRTDAKIEYNFIDNTLAGKQLVSPSALVVGTWTHLTFTLFNGTMTMYVNGAQVATRSDAPMSGIVLDTAFSIAALAGGSANNINAEYDDFRIFNSALTPAQIQTIYNSGGNLYGANTVQPALFWSFNGTLKESVTGYLPVGTTGATNPTGASLAFTSGKYGQGLQFIPYLSNGFGLWNTTTFSIPLAGTYFPYAGGMSVCFWYMPTSLANNGLLFSTASYKTLTSYGIPDLIYISLNTSGSIGLNTQATSGGTVPAFGVEMGKVAVNNWVHVAFGVDTQNIYMYINGILTGTRAQPSNWATTDITSSGYWMGAMAVGTQHFAAANGSLTGIMNDLRVYSSLLSASQIQAIYQSGGIPPSLTLTPSTPSLPSPQYAFPFNGSNVETITGLTPAVQYPITGNSALLGSAAYVKNAPNITTPALYCTGPYATSSNCMNLGSSTPANFDYNASNLFCEFWWYTSNTAGNLNTPISLGVINTTDTSYRIQVLLNSGFQLNFSTSVSNTTSLSASTWYHFAFSVDSTNKVIYPFVNGFGGVSASYAGTLSYNSAHSLMIGYSNALSTAYYYDQYIQDLRIVQGGIVPVTNFTPASPSFQYVLPSYVTGTGGTVFTLQSQFVNYTSGLLSGQAINFLSNASVSPATSNVTYNISLIPITSFTVTAWINPTILGKNQNIFIASYGQNTDGDLRMRVDYQSATPSSYKIWLGYPFVSGTWTSVNPATLYSVGQWAHVAITVSGGDMVSNVVTGYYNGSFIGTATSATRTNTNNLGKITIGSFCSGAFNSQFNGLVQDVRMYSQVLNATQIQTIYQSGGNLYGGNLVQPTYMWPFNGSVIDVVKGVAFNKSNVAGVDSSGSWPYYDSVGQRVGSSALLINNSLTPNASNLCGVQGATGFTCNFPFTSTYWVRLNTTSGAGGGNGQLIKFQSSPSITTSVNASSIGSSITGGSGGSTVNINFSLGQWLHVAVVANLNQVQLYVNGVPSSSVATPAVPYTTSSNFINFAMTSQNASGLVSGSCISCEYNDFRIFSGQALSTSQIQTIYQSGGARPSALLTTG